MVLLNSNKYASQTLGAIYPARQHPSSLSMYRYLNQRITLCVSAPRSLLEKTFPPFLISGTADAIYTVLLASQRRAFQDGMGGTILHLLDKLINRVDT